MSFNTWLQSSIDTYDGYYKIFYPLFFLGMAVQAVVSKIGGKLITMLVEKIPTDIILFGLPYYLIVAIAIVTLFFARYAEAIYHWDLSIVYGRQFKKLEELIADMEELRK